MKAKPLYAFLFIGERGTLFCRLENPSWFKDGKRISQYFQNYTTNGNLILYATSDRISGTYSCIGIHEGFIMKQTYIVLVGSRYIIFY